VADKNIIQAIRDKEMDRKDFLKYSGLALLGIVGLKTIATLLIKADNHKQTAIEPSKEVTRGFGSGKYGV
jgi:hypothetical protein